MRAITLLMVLAVMVRPAAAQSLGAARAGLTQHAAPSGARNESIVSVREIARTRWLEGTILGGALGLVSGLQLRNQICNHSDNGCQASESILAVAIPTLVLGIVGGLIGSAFHKD